MSRSYNAVFRTCPCSAGFYDSGALVCSPCVSPCQECVGGSRLNCTVCIAGYNLVGSSCVPILNCNTFYYDGNCVNTCPNITYNSGSSCLPCIYNCLTCTSNTITSCTSCLANFYFYTGMCLGICPTNTYSNNTNRSCIACPSECL
jgi:proprotein convertase subtilisin/kexin type 5